eukprot:scaffold56988_cov32-Tisochrysis_lutea.AAC.6
MTDVMGGGIGEWTGSDASAWSRATPRFWAKRRGHRLGRPLASSSSSQAARSAHPLVRAMSAASVPFLVRMPTSAPSSTRRMAEAGMRPRRSAALCSGVQPYKEKA